MKKAKTKTRVRTAEGEASSLGKFPRTMAALARAQRVTERASGCGFDWPTVEPVWDKIEEELRELKAVVASGGKGRVREEIGDLLLSLVNLSRFLGVEAEAALGEGVDRFLKRFSHIETRLRERGKSPAESSLEEMDALWEEAKRMERRP